MCVFCFLFLSRIEAGPAGWGWGDGCSPSRGAALVVKSRHFTFSCLEQEARRGPLVGRTRRGGGRGAGAGGASALGRTEELGPLWRWRFIADVILAAARFLIFIFKALQ